MRVTFVQGLSVGVTRSWLVMQLHRLQLRPSSSDPHVRHCHTQPGAERVVERETKHVCVCVCVRERERERAPTISCSMNMIKCDSLLRCLPSQAQMHELDVRNTGLGLETKSVWVVSYFRQSCHDRTNSVNKHVIDNDEFGRRPIPQHSAVLKVGRKGIQELWCAEVGTCVMSGTLVAS